MLHNYRAWNTEKKTMVYGNEDQSREYWDGAQASDIEMVNNVLAPASYKNYIWMQLIYQDIRDGSVYRVYDGDILMSATNGYTYYIKCGEFNLCYCLISCKTGQYVTTLNQSHLTDLIKVGNIYDNAHLLEEEL